MPSIALLILLKFAVLAHANTDPSMQLQDNDERCARVAVASKRNMNIAKENPTLKGCAEASRDVCEETKTLLGNTINSGKLSGCHGQKLAMGQLCRPYTGDWSLGAVNPGVMMWVCPANGSRWAGDKQRCDDSCR